MEEKIKTILFENCLASEEDYVDEIKVSSRTGVTRQREQFYKGAFSSLYNLICQLGMEKEFNEWEYALDEAEEDVV